MEPNQEKERADILRYIDLQLPTAPENTAFFSQKGTEDEVLILSLSPQGEAFETKRKAFIEELLPLFEDNQLDESYALMETAKAELILLIVEAISNQSEASNAIGEATAAQQSCFEACGKVAIKNLFYNRYNAAEEKLVQANELFDKFLFAESAENAEAAMKEFIKIEIAFKNHEREIWALEEQADKENLVGKLDQIAQRTGAFSTASKPQKKNAGILREQLRATTTASDLEDVRKLIESAKQLINEFTPTLEQVLAKGEGRIGSFNFKLA